MGAIWGAGRRWRMANKDLSLKPHDPKDKAWWWYEDSYGINVYHQKEGTTKNIKIPWTSLRKALARKDK